MLGATVGIKYSRQFALQKEALKVDYNPSQTPAAQPSEGNVQAFLDQARRLEHALQPRPSADDLPEDNENDIFDDNEEVPY